MNNAVTIPTPAESLHLATTEIIFSKILVAIDFSAQTTQVLKTAIAIADCCHSEIVFVHATWPEICGTGAELVPVGCYELDLEIAQQKMADLVAAEPRLQLIKHREIVAYASAVELVRQTVESEKTDLVILGSHGASGLERLALGSIAESMLRHIGCPSLIVGPRSTYSVRPFRSILLASSLKPSALRAAQYASALAEKFHGKFTLLHVMERRPETTQVEPELTEQRAREALDSLIPGDMNFYGKARVRVEYGDAAEIISHIAECECASLIVCGVSEVAALADHTLGSVLVNVIRRASCPVLCVAHHFVT
jgi:nucleotide-binding universal stress UspA family protein